MHLKLKTLLMLMFLLASFPMSAQTGLVEQWDKRYGGSLGDAFSFADMDSAGNFFMVGMSLSPVSGLKTQPNWDATCQTADFWLVYIDSIGTKYWDRRFGGANNDALQAVVLDNQGIAMAGFIGGSASGDIGQGSRGDWDYWLIKADRQGNTLWNNRFGGPGADYLTALAQGQDEGYLLGGYSFSGIGGDKTQPNWDSTYFNADGWVVKTDKDGNKLWDKRYGSSKHEVITSIAGLPGGGFIVGANTQATIDNDGDVSKASHGYTDFWLFEIDSAGNKIWDRTIGTPGEEYLSQIQLCRDENIIVTGFSTGTPGGDFNSPSYGWYDFWVVKIDKNGNKLWDRGYGGSQIEGLPDVPNIIETKDGGFLIFGTSQSDISGIKTEDNHNYPYWGGDAGQLWMVKTDSAGNVQWDKTIWIASSGGGLVKEIDQNCYLIFASVDSVTGGYLSAPCSWDCSNNDAWVAKFCIGAVSVTETTGDLQWQIGPNPATNELSIFLSKPGLNNATFTITNSLGQTVYQKQENNLSDSYTKMLDITYLPAGTYFVTVTVGNQKAVKQIVKQ